MKNKILSRHETLELGFALLFEIVEKKEWELCYSIVENIPHNSLNIDGLIEMMTINYMGEIARDIFLSITREMFNYNELVGCRKSKGYYNIRAIGTELIVKNFPDLISQEIKNKANEFVKSIKGQSTERISEELRKIRYSGENIKLGRGNKDLEFYYVVISNFPPKNLKYDELFYYLKHITYFPEYGITGDLLLKISKEKFDHSTLIKYKNDYDEDVKKLAIKIMTKKFPELIPSSIINKANQFINRFFK